MELRHLRYFVAVADALSFSRAAAKLNIAQPPLNRQVRGLERELGTSLLQRDGKRIRLTPAGEAFYNEAKDILARCQGATRIAKAFDAGESGTLNISYMPSGFCYEIVVEIVRRHQAAFPLIKLTLTQMTAKAQIEAFASNQTDIAILNKGTRYGPDLKHVCIAEEPIDLMLPHGHPLLALERITFDDIKDEPLIVTRRDSSADLHDRFIKPWTDRGCVPNIVQEIDSFALSVFLVECGLGVSFSSPQLRNRFVARVETRPIVDYNVLGGADIVWRKDGETPLVLGFLNLVHAVKAERGFEFPASP